MNIKQILEKNLYVILAFAGVILVVALGLYTSKSFFYWDEIVYLAMSKFILYGGNAGLYEMIRPPIIPLILTPFAWISKSPVILYRFISLIISFSLLTLIFFYTKKYTTKRGGIVALLAFAATAIFIRYSFRISAVLLALVFMIIALFFLDKKKFIWAGFFISIAFLTRFPMGILALSIGLAMTIDVIHNILKQKTKKKKIKEFKSFIKNAFKLFISFVIPIMLFLIHNIIRTPNKTLIKAALDPFFFASSAITGTYVWLYKQGFFYYAIELTKEMPLLGLVPLAIIGLIYLQIKQKKTVLNENVLIIFTIIAFIYFSQLSHKELRYGIIFLPSALMLIPIAIHRLYQFINKKKSQVRIAMVFTTILTLTVLFGVHVIVDVNPLGLFQKEVYPVEATHSFECYSFLNEHTKAPVVSTTPYPAVFLSNKIVPSYYTLEFVKKQYQDYDFLILTPNDFLCAKRDKICMQANDALIYDIVKDNDVLFYEQNKSKECMVLTKKNIKTVSTETKRKLKQKVLNRFSYKDTVELSVTPYAKKASAFIVLNDITPLKDNKIMDQDKLNGVVKLLRQKDIPFILGVIPKTLSVLKDNDLFYIQKISEDENIEIIQKGYDFNGDEKQDTFFGKSFSEQKKLMKQGKNLIYKYLFVKPDIFFVPYIKSDQNTINALLESGFSTIMTGTYDPVYTRDIVRYNVGVETVTDWQNMKIDDLSELKKRTDLVHSPYVLVNMYYYTITEDEIDQVSQYIDWLKENYHATTVEQYSNWVDTINSIEYKLTESEFIIKNVSKYKDSPIGLVTRSDIRLTTNKNNLYIRNEGFSDSMVCINDQCKKVLKDKTEMFEGITSLN